jgi:hypothetical protein
MMIPLSCKRGLVLGTLSLGAALLAAGPARAQSGAPDAAPAVDTGAMVEDAPPATPPAAAPAPGKAPAAKPAPADDSNAGTTIIGDKESPIGLYLTPWKNEYADRDMDRAAQFVRDDLTFVDQQVFDRQIQYYDRINAYRATEPAPAKK